MQTLYGKHEPTTDDVIHKYAPKSKRKDTVLYRDKDCAEIACRIPWHHKNRPISRKTITLNCWNYSIEWIKD